MGWPCGTKGGQPRRWGGWSARGRCTVEGHGMAERPQAVAGDKASDGGGPVLWGPDSPWPLSLSFPACRTETAPPQGRLRGRGHPAMPSAGWGRGRECGLQSPWRRRGSERRPAVPGRLLCVCDCCVTPTLCQACFQTAFCSPARASAQALQPPLSLPTSGVAPRLPKSHYRCRLPLSEAPSSAAPALLLEDKFL